MTQPPMEKYVAFLRAINVAGHAMVAMSDLRDAYTAAGCKNVRTYINSGNVVFEIPEAQASAVFPKIRTKVRKLIGGEPEVLFRTVRELEDLVKRTPFKSYESETNIKFYVAFLSQKPSAKPALPLMCSEEAVEAIGINNLDVLIVSRPKRKGFFGFPNAFIEKEFGVSATSRNWNTVTKVLQFARSD